MPLSLLPLSHFMRSWLSFLGTPAAISINVSSWWSKRGLWGPPHSRSARGAGVKSDWLTQRSGCQSASCAGGTGVRKLDAHCSDVRGVDCQSQAEIEGVLEGSLHVYWRKRDRLIASKLMQALYHLFSVRHWSNLLCTKQDASLPPFLLFLHLSQSVAATVLLDLNATSMLPTLYDQPN